MVNGFISFLILISLTSSLWANGLVLKSIPSGIFEPLVKSMKPIPVEPFSLAEHAVTNAEYLKFVWAHSEWQKGNVPALFADKGYLRHWEKPLEPGLLAPDDAPVTSISWFAARAYAEWIDMRLPTLAEWEHAAALFSEEGLQSKVLAWYSKPLHLPLPEVKTVEMNAQGVWDLHGLIWEWTEDFDSISISNRTGGEDTANFFCGGGATGVTDPSDYAAFIRYAMRSSLSPVNTIAGLGFRVASHPEIVP